MRVKILTCGHTKIGEIVEAKRYKDLTIKEIESSLGSCYKWENIDGCFIQYVGNEWEYMTDDEVEIIEE